MSDKENKIQAITEEVRACEKCELHKTRNKPVIGGGSLDAKIMFIGEGPGFNEDVQGKPFVGRAGRVLDELLALAGLKRDEIYIANILKCRPPDNRDPKAEEVASCTPYLNRQIGILRPETICPMGNSATSYILAKFGLNVENIGKVHGKIFKVRNLLLNTRIIPLYHPASALYNPNMKTTLMEDFRLIKGD